jgi:hypothetical protein
MDACRFVTVITTMDSKTNENQLFFCENWKTCRLDKKINILEIFGEKIKSEKMSDKKMVWLQPATFATF